ncbi:hypothetical protein SAMN03080602_02886 [Arenibacter troitsensis]|uniref:Uncharacterized protein n=1 Tax=Arenibacter troitsensis TaxID=188872 RepID=A0A1X7KI40_9FLAO|nr:hypothetical protein SAMN03080602_02886 [Arenibacter troitsensis]
MPLCTSPFFSLLPKSSSPEQKNALPSIKPLLLHYLVVNLKVVFELYFSPGFRTTDGKSN